MHMANVSNSVSEAVLKAQLTKTLDSTDLSKLPRVTSSYFGKVRDNFSVDGDRRIIVVSDRISAFDVVLGTIPFKGQVLNQMASYWFEETKHIARSHVIALPDPNVMVAVECTPLKAEFVMRSYLTGVTSTSIWVAYEEGAREFCGHPLPEGMKKNQALPRAILTPSTKAEKGDHDESVSRAELIRRGAIDAASFDEAAAMCEQLFAFGQKRAAERGLILVDTKYELGRTPAGEIVVIDEIHTPDSSRYWYADDYEARLARGEEPRGLDKEYVRRWLVSERGYKGDGPPPALTDEVRVEAARRYIANFELVTGRAFQPDTDEPQARIRKNVESYLALK
jgi:phosphoribosylaminoimidazole-succinocarboxamide synthase